MKPRAATSGFSVPEFAVVVAVTALIAGVLASAYKTYVVRRQILAGIALAGNAEDEVTRWFDLYGEPPPDRKSTRLPRTTTDDATRFVDRIDIVDGRVRLRFGTGADPAIAGRTLSLTPFETVDRKVLWICGNRVAGPGLKPLGFANGSRQAVQVVTEIESRFLPSACR